MAYIGKSPQQGNYVVLDTISTASQNTYNLLNGGVAFTPESANHMIVSLNGVIQAPNTAFSVSGSTITFLPSSGTLSSADTIDFIMVLGNVLDIGTPSDSTVTNAKTNFVSSSSSAGLSIKGDGTTSGTGGVLQLNCSYNSHGIKLESPAHSAGQSYTLKFPTGNVTAGKVLKVDSVTGSGATGVGQLSFGDGGGLVKLLDATISSAVSYYDIDSTYINSTYDSYEVEFVLRSSSDNDHLLTNVFVGGSIPSGNIYAWTVNSQGDSAVASSSASSGMRVSRYSVGNETGAFIGGRMRMKNVNSTSFPYFQTGQSVCYSYSNGVFYGMSFAGGLILANRADVVNGLRFYYGANIESGTIKVYGIT